MSKNIHTTSYEQISNEVTQYSIMRQYVALEGDKSLRLFPYPTF